jgi:hypothetical protein
MQQKQAQSWENKAQCIGADKLGNGYHDKNKMTGKKITMNGRGSHTAMHDDAFNRVTTSSYTHLVACLQVRYLKAGVRGDIFKFKN